MSWLVMLVTIVLIFTILQKNSNFLDVRSIFREHIRIFNGNTLQLLSIFIVPLVYSIAIVRIKLIDEIIINNLNIVLSIIIAMLFSITSILSAFNNTVSNEKYKTLLRQTFNTAIFEVILCLFTLLISFIVLFIGKTDGNVIHHIISITLYYMPMVILLNILILLKRIKILFDYSN